MDTRLAKQYIQDAIDKMANNPYGATSQLNTRLAMEKLRDAIEQIDTFVVELAGKEAVIKELHKDIAYYRKDWKDQMIQDQGLDDEAI